MPVHFSFCSIFASLRRALLQHTSTVHLVDSICLGRLHQINNTPFILPLISSPFPIRLCYFDQSEHVVDNVLRCMIEKRFDFIKRARV